MFIKIKLWGLPVWMFLLFVNKETKRNKGVEYLRKADIAWKHHRGQFPTQEIEQFWSPAEGGRHRLIVAPTSLPGLHSRS